MARVLLACIKQLSKCPCPTCLVLKKNVRLLGTMRDSHMHARKCHTDNEIYRSKIKIARNYVYKSGGFLNGHHLDILLGPESLVPTRVSRISFPMREGLSIYRVHFPIACQSMASTISPCLYQTCFMSLSWVFGRPFLSIL